MTEVAIVNNEIVKTETQPLEEYIAQKKMELDMIETEITLALDRKNHILSELESLIQ